MSNNRRARNRIIARKQEATARIAEEAVAAKGGAVAEGRKDDQEEELAEVTVEMTTVEGEMMTAVEMEDVVVTMTEAETVVADLGVISKEVGLGKDQISRGKDRHGTQTTSGVQGTPTHGEPMTASATEVEADKTRLKVICRIHRHKTREVEFTVRWVCLQFAHA